MYEEKPIKILETSERVNRTKTIKFCKVQWSHHTEEEATWEREDELREDHPHLFASQPESRGEIHLKGVRLVTSQFLGKNLKILHMKIMPSFHAFFHLCIAHFQVIVAMFF
jgi:hypothetical protein